MCAVQRVARQPAAAHSAWRPDQRRRGAVWRSTVAPALAEKRGGLSPSIVVA